MKRVRLLVSLGVLGLLAGPAVSQLTPYKVDGGRVVITFFEDVLTQNGLELVDMTETAEVFDAASESMTGELHGFAIRDDSDLMALRNAEGNFQPYGVLDGSINAAGGFFLYSPSTGEGIDLHDFVIRPEEIRNDGPGGQPDPDYFVMAAGNDPATDLFDLCYVKVFFKATDGYEPPTPGDHEQGAPQLHIKAWDLVATEELARKLGRPELTGRFLAYGKIVADVSAWEGPWEHPQGQNVFTPYQGTGGTEGLVCGGCLDVSLGILSSITQVGHVGTFPTGRAGISMSTTSCNLGDVNVNWLAAMNEDHPGILMTLYRHHDSLFEQIGISWIKHGFFALSNSQCIPCQNPSNGTFLGVGCSDTYGTGNNSDPFWLGPRGEWNAFTATWTCLGSFFDGAPVNCVRNENGSGFGAVNHRCEAYDADLGDPESTYYYEGYYLVKNDDNLVNNLGSRRCTMTWTGSAWSFTTPGSNALVEGPTIYRWPEAELFTEVSLKPADGQVVLAVNTTQLGPNSWRYDYALYNWHLFREIGAFSIPVAGNVQNIYFHDHDDSAANDWTPVVGGNKLTFTFPEVFTGDVKEAGPLSFGELYNFGFTSFRAPGNRDTALDVYLPGVGGDRIAVPTIGPAFMAVSASTLSPSVGQTIDLKVQGGSDLMYIAIIEVSGIPITPVLLGGVPFVAGEATTPVTIPAGLSGISLTMVGLDIDSGTLQVIDLSNANDLVIQ